MNEYSLCNISEGLTESFHVCVTEEMMDYFLKLSGDVNPLHCSTQYANDRGFRDRVVYGMLTASFFSTLAGVYLPGKKCLLQKVHSDFIKPVYIGDNLLVSGTVKTKHESLSTIIIKAKITRDEEMVAKAEIWAGILNE